MKLPKVVYIAVDGEKGEEYLYASESLDDLPDGVVGVFRLDELLHSRTVTEIRRDGTKAWFKPSATGKVVK